MKIIKVKELSRNNKRTLTLLEPNGENLTPNLESRINNSRKLRRVLGKWIKSLLLLTHYIIELTLQIRMTFPLGILSNNFISGILKMTINKMFLEVSLKA